MSLFRRQPTCALDRERPKTTIEEPGDVYLHFPIEHNCPACQAKVTVTFIYAMNKRNLSANKLIGMKNTAHNCVPSYVPGEGYVPAEAGKGHRP